MKRQIVSALFALGLISAAPAGAQVLPEGTPVKVQSTMEVSSGSVQTGDLVTFKTVAPVQVGGVTVVEKGALARGIVMFANGAAIGHGGQLLISVDSVQATDGSWLPLSVTNNPGDVDTATLPDRLLPAHTNGFPNGKDKVLVKTPFTLYIGQNTVFANSGGHPVVKARAPKANGKMLMPVGTEILLHATHDLSTKDISTGDKVDFVVAAPVKIQGVLVVAKGAKAHGHAALANSSDIGGSNGQFLLSVDVVQTVDGQWVPVRASQAQLGKDNQLIRTGLGLLTPIAAILPGHNAVIKAGQVFSLVTHKDIYVGGPKR